MPRSSPNDFVDAYEGMTGGGETGHASIGDAAGDAVGEADGEGALVRAAVDRLSTDAQPTQPALPGENSGAYGALDFVPPTATRAAGVVPSGGFASDSSESAGSSGAYSAGHLPCDRRRTLVRMHWRSLGQHWLISFEGNSGASLRALAHSGPAHSEWAAASAARH